MNIISIQRETLLKPLSAIIGVVERRQALPILSNVYLSVKDNALSVTATDLEVELQAKAELENTDVVMDITVPARKLLDICRSLPENSQIELLVEKEKVILKSGRSRFSLSMLPAPDFPLVRDLESAKEFVIAQRELRYLIERTHFAMAQQDVRYYLNGMLLELTDGIVRTVATDGHRLSLNTVMAPVIDNTLIQVILPKKGVIELLRLLEDSDSEALVKVSSSHIHITSTEFAFISKLIDGRFPDYEKVLPRGGDKAILVNRDELKHALSRASILSNEKFRGIRLQLKSNVLKVFANNPEHEEAEEEINISYDHEDLEIGFNVSYLLDVLNTVQGPEIKITLSDPKSSILIEEPHSQANSLFVVMPMML